MAYSMDYRRRAVEYKDEGHTFKELEEVFKISPQTYYDWKKKFDSGYYQQKRTFERKRKIDKIKLKQAVEQKPDIYLHELAAIFECSISAIFYALQKLKITRKKNVLLMPKSPKRNAPAILHG